jgi:acid stress-induced BolA-like protein IbaG/YrbA
VGLSEKIIAALQAPLNAEYVRLEDDDGISGFVVSRRFENMSTLDRQQLIDEVLRNGPDPLSHEEQRQILLIAGLTPREYDSANPRIRVHRIREQTDGSLEILLHGPYSDAMYVRDALENEEGVQTTEPEQVPGAIGILMKFSAKGTAKIR